MEFLDAIGSQDSISQFEMEYVTSDSNMSSQNFINQIKNSGKASIVRRFGSFE